MWSWLVSFFICSNAYETWHLVDLAQVVCPKPTYPNAPVFPDYNLGINYTSDLVVDSPHIVGFIRASQQAMKITFKIEDFYGEQAGVFFKMLCVILLNSQFAGVVDTISQEKLVSVGPSVGQFLSA